MKLRTALAIWVCWLLALGAAHAVVVKPYVGLRSADWEQWYNVNDTSITADPSYIAWCRHDTALMDQTATCRFPVDMTITEFSFTLSAVPGSTGSLKLAVGGTAYGTSSSDWIRTNVSSASAGCESNSITGALDAAGEGCTHKVNLRVPAGSDFRVQWVNVSGTPTLEGTLYLRGRMG